MEFIEQLEEEPLSEMIRYHSGAPKDAIAYAGTLRKQPYDEGKCILFAEPQGAESESPAPSILEFRKSDIVAVEELPSIVDETGHSRPVMRLWIRRGSLGIRYEPFEVGEPPRASGASPKAGSSRLRDHMMSRTQG
jgi:hypothetical protein